MRKCFYIAVVVILLYGCGGAAVENEKMELAGVWNSGQSVRNILSVSGIDDKRVYVWGEAGDNYVLKTFDLSGRIAGEAVYRKGRGPGELTFPAKGRRLNGRVYIYDSYLKRMNIYDKKGDIESDFMVDSEDVINDFIITDDSVILHGVFRKKFVKVSLEDGRVIKETAYEYPPDTSGDRIDIVNGILCNDPENKRFFIVYHDRPLRAEEYDYDLRLIRTHKLPPDRGRGKYYWQKEKNYNIPVGYDMAPSAAFGGGKLYIGSPVLNMWEGGHYSREFHDKYVVEYDPDSGRAARIYSEAVDGLKNSCSLLGVADGLLVGCCPVKDLDGGSAGEKGLAVLVFRLSPERDPAGAGGAGLTFSGPGGVD